MPEITDDKKPQPYCVRLGPHPDLGCSYWVKVQGRCPKCNCERSRPERPAGTA